MKKRKIQPPITLAGTLFCLLLGVVIAGEPLMAQENSSPLMQIREQAVGTYELSKDLMNGEKYNNPYRSVRGTPFLEFSGDPLATVRYRGEEYRDQHIRYDLFNQIMILDFTDMAGASSSLVLKNEWIEEVVVGGRVFRPLNTEEGARFGQVIGSGTYTIVYFWEKQYLPDMHEGNGQYFFSEAIHKSCLFYRNACFPYKSNGQLVRRFPVSLRSRVRGYLKENQIRVKRALDREMEALLGYVNQQASYED